VLPGGALPKVNGYGNERYTYKDGLQIDRESGFFRLRRRTEVTYTTCQPNNFLYGAPVQQRGLHKSKTQERRRSTVN
jgi:hypothetical protein